MFAVQVVQLQKNFMVGGESLPILKDISFSIDKGELVGITGPSGSGKSTLLHILGTLDLPSAGDVFIDGKKPHVGNDQQVSEFRNRHIGFVFQHNNLLPEFSALENVMMPGLIAGFKESVVRQRATELLKRVGMIPRAKHFPSQLSGGEQQRVAIARALINNPVLLLADEPSGNLDSTNATNVHQLFAEINRSLGTTVVVVTHNMQFAASLPRLIELQDGQVVCKNDLHGE